jgi:hypothetical protein
MTGGAHPRVLLKRLIIFIYLYSKKDDKKTFRNHSLLNSIIMSTVTLTAYNVKTKEKNVPVLDAVITKTAKGAYMAQGNDGKGNKLTTLLGEAKALAAIEAGIAKKGW